MNMAPQIIKDGIIVQILILWSTLSPPEINPMRIEEKMMIPNNPIPACSVDEKSPIRPLGFLALSHASHDTEPMSPNSDLMRTSAPER